MPSSYNHSLQESLVQHFSIANFNDLEERVNQLMVARHAHTQLSHTHALHQSCSYCYHHSHWIDDCSFLNHYMTEANKSVHENAQTTAKFVSEKIANEVVSEFNLKDPKMECFTQDDWDLDLDRLVGQDGVLHELSLEDPEIKYFAQNKDDLDLDRLSGQDSVLYEASLEDPEVECFAQSDMDLDKSFKQVVMFRESSLNDHLEESFAQFEFDLDLDMIHDQAKALLDLVLEMRTENGEEDKVEQIEPPPIPNLSNENEVSTEAHSFVTIPLETHHENQVSFCHCLMALTYAIIIKDLCTEGHKSRNNLPKKIRLNKKVGYLRWRNILPEGYQVLMKKGWK